MNDRGDWLLTLSVCRSYRAAMAASLVIGFDTPEVDPKGEGVSGGDMGL
jgi:hypothetical protein